MTNNYALK